MAKTYLLNIAMPVAHILGPLDYSGWYSAGVCLFAVSHYFNSGGSKGISLKNDAGAVNFVNFNQTDLWNLYAFTHGFLSFRNNSLVLRLPRELKDEKKSKKDGPAKYNSGEQFMRLTPPGPQLRHVVYLFSAKPAPSAVGDKIKQLLADANHPGRAITRIAKPAGKTQLLGDFLDEGAANVDMLVQKFLGGTAEILVQCGDVIGNFKGLDIEIRFLDSCGNPVPDSVTGTPIAPRGRPLNPSYYLYIVRSQANAKYVSLLDNLSANLTSPHPLDHIFNAANIPATGNKEQALDMTADHPPKPLHATIDVRNSAGTDIAKRGISIDALGMYHESRNFAKSSGTTASLRWRNYGNQIGQTDDAWFCKLISEVKLGKKNLLPLADLDPNFEPSATQSDNVKRYWDRYYAIFNLVADAFEIPCELLLAIACTETSDWFNSVLTSSHEMDVIRMEPLKGTPPNPSSAQQIMLTNYKAIAGSKGANPKIPVPWDGTAYVASPNDLRWSELAGLVRDFKDNVQVSPGIMQILVSSARGDLDWVGEIYGTDYVEGLSILHNTVTLRVSQPPQSLNLLFSDWFGESVNINGRNDNAELTQMKRALHCIVAGAAHLKRAYNTINPSKKGSYNLVCDFDLPTVSSGYNLGASVIVDGKGATANSSSDTKWIGLFGMKIKAEYPQRAPNHFNAAVEYFNKAEFPAGVDKPALRLWRP
jgi:hypothetical protein